MQRINSLSLKPSSSYESYYVIVETLVLCQYLHHHSLCFRHAAETQKLLDTEYGDNIPPVLILYTDGGPDHRCNFLSVIYSMIWLWYNNDIDYLILARNAPGHSWRNPAERVMSVLNVGLQSIGVMRERADDDEMEKKIKRYDLGFFLAPKLLDRKIMQ